MKGFSRRIFLKRGSIAVAMAGLATSTPLLTEATTQSPAVDAGVTNALPEGAQLTEPVVAHLRDLSSGEINLFVGNRQVVLNDPSLAHAIFRATR
jgi:hypothetical protein